MQAIHKQERGAAALSKGLYRLAGGAAGFINGLFGGGGGMVLVPLLLKSGQLRAKETFAGAVAIIFPICAVSFAAQLFFIDFPWGTAVPYLIGGAAGGLAGGKLFRQMPPLWLKRIFALFILYGAWRYLT